MADAQAQSVRPAAPNGSFLEVLAERVRATPDREALSWVHPRANGFVSTTITYAGLAHRAAAFVALCRSHSVGAGDRVLMSTADPQTVLAAVVGGMAMGSTIVPLQTRGEFRTHALFRERVTRVAADCQPRLIVVDNRDQWQASVGGEINVPAVETPSTPGTLPKLSYEAHDASTPAIVQYTSGSTGTPRGVVLTQKNVAANCRAVGVTSRSGPEDRMLSWLPLHHDMGLVGGLLFTAYWAIPSHILPPSAFLMRPVTWLRAIAAFRATLTVAPTFAYSLCWRKIPDAQLVGLDLSSCRLAYCGAEPIDAEVVRGFSARFAAYGFRPSAFYPVYGLAEATLAVAFPEPGTVPVIDVVDRSALAREGVARVRAADASAASLVSVGGAVDEHAIRVVDPVTRTECPERGVGEIVVRGPSISPRYYGDGANLVRAELATGDLGYLAAGRLFVIDRLKDLVIIRGQNFAPSDIETWAARARGVRKGRLVAFSLPGSEGTEQLHLVAELDARSWRRQAAIRAEMSGRILEAFGIKVSGVALVAPGTLPRTSSGKLRRRTCRDLYAAGAYKMSLTLGRRARIVWRALTVVLATSLARGERPGGAG